MMPFAIIDGVRAGYHLFDALYHPDSTWLSFSDSNVNTVIVRYLEIYRLSLVNSQDLLLHKAMLSAL